MQFGMISKSDSAFSDDDAKLGGNCLDANQAKVVDISLRTFRLLVNRSVWTEKEHQFEETKSPRNGLGKCGMVRGKMIL